MIITPIKIGRITSSSQSNILLSLGFIGERKGVGGFINLTIRNFKLFEKTYLRRFQKSEIDIKHGTVRLDGETKREYRSTER